MEPFQIVRRNIVKEGSEFRLAPPPPPPETRSWSTFAAFVPGDLTDVRKRIDAVRIGFKADVIPADGGVWISAGYSDLMRIVTALTMNRIKD